MHDLDEESESPISPEQSASSRGLRIAGLVVIILGLLLVLVGVVLGNLVYTSNQGLWRATQVAVEGINGTQPDGLVISGASFDPPSVAEMVLAEPPTWLGGIAVIGGIFLLAASAPSRAPEFASEAEPPEPGSPDDESSFDSV